MRAYDLKGALEIAKQLQCSNEITTDIGKAEMSKRWRQDLMTEIVVWKLILATQKRSENCRVFWKLQGDLGFLMIHGQCEVSFLSDLGRLRSREEPGNCDPPGKSPPVPQVGKGERSLWRSILCSTIQFPTIRLGGNAVVSAIWKGFGASSRMRKKDRSS